VGINGQIEKNSIPLFDGASSDQVKDFQFFEHSLSRADQFVLFGRESISHYSRSKSKVINTCVKEQIGRHTCCIGVCPQSVEI